MAELSYSYVSRLLEADFHAGRLFWLQRTPDMFPDGGHTSEHSCRKWNGRYAGKEAFTAYNGYGYRMGRIRRKGHLAHRVIWLLYTGAWPNGGLDHINGVRDDNRILNLRSVSQSENCRNQKRRSDNTSGKTGISWDKQRGKWQASVNMGGSKITLGRFSDFADAVAARRLAETEYGFHPNHGR